MAGASGLDPVAAVRAGAGLPSAPSVVALSGGADSAVCAWAAVDSGAEVRAVFVDHGFPESAALAQAARAIAANLGIDLDEVSVTVPLGPSPENQARTVRLAALEESLKPGELLLSGHTADDQAETVLGNLLRGSGAAGLGGIPREREVWLRPLLGIDRATVRAAADALGLPYADDPTNRSLGPRRNQLRHEVMPLLRDRFNPQLSSALSRTARLAGNDDAVLERLAGEVPMIDIPTGVKVPAAALDVLSPAVASRVARRAIRRVRGPHGGEQTEIDAVVGAIDGVATTIGDSVQVSLEGPWVTLSRPMPTPAVPVEVGSEGATEFWGGSIVVEPGTRWRPLGGLRSIVTAGPMTVRPARAGDEIAIAGGHKKVSTVLAEGGVPIRLRPHWPVLECNDAIAWVIGIRSAPHVSDGGRTVTLMAELVEL